MLPCYKLLLFVEFIINRKVSKKLTALYFTSYSNNLKWKRRSQGATKIAIPTNMKTKKDLTLFGTRRGILLSPCAFEIRFFFQLNFYKKFPINFMVKAATFDTLLGLLGHFNVFKGAQKIEIFHCFKARAK